MTQPAYYLSWSSAPGQHGWTATLRHQDEHNRWRTLLEWNVYRIDSGRRRMMHSILADQGRSTNAAWVGHLHTHFEHHHRIAVAELLTVLDDGVAMPMI